MLRRFWPLLAVLAACALAACGGTTHHPSQAATGSVHPAEWGLPAPVSARLFALAPQATVTMYDSTTVGEIPASPFAAAGYTAGNWPTFFSLRRLWPRTHTISIAVNANDHADCLDVEPGDATPSQAPGWVRSDERAGWRKPCLYSDWWEWTRELIPALKRAGIKLGSVFRWVASYVGHPQLLAGYDAEQYDDHCLGRNLDCSLVLRSFLSIAHPALKPPAPKPKPKPKPVPKPKPSPQAKLRGELRALDLELGAHTRRNPRGHNCAHPPFRHAYPSARWNRRCAAWATQARRIKREMGR